jgi:5-formyltetrahydrofolate cyclo-ligase
MTTLRQSIIKHRQQLSLANVEKFSTLICNQLIQLPQFKTAQNIACYLPIKNEVDTSSIIEKIWQENKNCYVPICNVDHTLQFVAYNKDTVCETNQYGIQQPSSSKANDINTQHLDLVITPLVIFDPNCTRVGWGKGHYDRSFEFLNHGERGKPFLVGVAYECQKVEALKCESWDIALDIIVTEDAEYLLPTS